jgi:hypothetical protein
MDVRTTLAGSALIVSADADGRCEIRVSNGRKCGKTQPFEAPVVGRSRQNCRGFVIFAALIAALIHESPSGFFCGRTISA